MVVEADSAMPLSGYLHTSCLVMLISVDILVVGMLLIWLVWLSSLDLLGLTLGLQHLTFKLIYLLHVKSWN